MHTLTGSDPTPFFDVAVDVPAEGEEITAATAAAGKGPVRPGFQGQHNRDVALHAALLHESLVPRVRLMASNTGSTIYLSMPGRYALITGAGVRYLAAGPEEGLITPILLKPAPAASWPADSLLYLYAVASAITPGLMAFEVWTTAPDPGQLFKGDAPGTHRYVGCFYTGALGVPIPFSGDRGVYRLATPRGTTAPGTDGAYTAVVLTGLVPPHARRVLVHGSAVGDTTGAQDLYVRSGGLDAGTVGTVVASAPKVANPPALTATAQGRVDMMLFGGALQYRVSGASVSAAGVYVGGWTE